MNWNIVGPKNFINLHETLHKMTRILGEDFTVRTTIISALICLLFRLIETSLNKN
jgi:hypothetical protein